jgi:hypothetical protein
LLNIAVGLLSTLLDLSDGRLLLDDKFLNEVRF